MYLQHSRHTGTIQQELKNCNKPYNLCRRDYTSNHCCYILWSPSCVFFLVVDVFYMAFNCVGRYPKNTFWLWKERCESTACARGRGGWAAQPCWGGWAGVRGELCCQKNIRYLWILAACLRTPSFSTSLLRWLRHRISTFSHYLLLIYLVPNSCQRAQIICKI